MGRGKLNNSMKSEDMGLGTISLSDSLGDPVVLRVSVDKEILKIEINKEDINIITLTVEDESDISDLISILESCFNFM